MSKRIRVADDCSPAGSSLSSSSASGGGRPITISSSPYFSKAAERIPTHRRKRRCWQFHVTGITRDGSGGGFDLPGKQAAVLASFREKYTATKRLSFSRPTGFNDTDSFAKSSGDASRDRAVNSRGGVVVDDSDTSRGGGVVVEVQFTGPQPGEGPAGLLRGLLYGKSVEARPVKLRRGRKKLARTDSFSSGETSDVGSDAVPDKKGCGTKKTEVLGSTHSDSLDGSSGSSGACDDNNKKEDANVQQEESITSPIYDDDEERDSGGASQQCTLIKPEECGYSGGVGSVEPSTSGTEDNETSLSDHESFWGQDLYGDSWGLDLADDAVCGGGAGDLSPNTVQPPLGRWGFGSTVFGDGALLESGGEEAKAAWEREAGLCPPVESGAVCVGDAGEADGAKKDEDGRVLGDNASLEELVLVPVGTVAVGYFREECDFEGRRRWQSKSTTAPVAASGFIADSEDFVVLGGLEGSDQTLRSLTATVHFQVDAVHRVEKAMGPIQVGADGRVHATVLYPSMKEIWPEMYITKNVRVVEVDATVKVRSHAEQVRYVGPQLKVSYRRAMTSGGDAGQRIVGQGPQMCARLSKAAGLVTSSNDPMVF